MRNEVSIKIKVDANTKTLEELNKKLGETRVEAKALGKDTDLHLNFESKEIVIAKKELDELAAKAMSAGAALNLKVRVAADGNIKMLTSDFEDLKAKAAAAENGVSSFGDKVKGIATAAAGLYVVHEAFGVLKDGAKKAIEVTAQFETFSATLKTITGSSIEAKKAMAWIEDFAAKTPYELADVTAAFVKLKSYGIDPIKGDTLKTLGDTASAMGKTLDQAVEAMADAMTGEYERLKEFGIKSSSEGDKVKFAWATASGELREITVKNNADIVQDTLKTIWNEKYKGAMDERSKTFEGLASNLADNVNKALRTIAEESGAFDGIKNGITEVSAYLGSLTKDDIREFTEGVKTATKAAAALVEVFAVYKTSGWLLTGLSFVIDNYKQIATAIRAAAAAQVTLNLAMKANPVMLAAGVIATAVTAFTFMGDEAEKSGDKATKAMDKTAEAAKEAEKTVKGSAIGKTKAEAEAAAEIEKNTKELKDKLKGYSEERRLSHEKTVEGLKKKELELKDAIEKAQKELHDKLKKLETERLDSQRDLNIKIAEINRGMMDNASAYEDKLKQADKAYALAKEDLRAKDLESYKKHMAEYLRLTTENAGKAIEVDGKVVVSKETTANIAKEAIKKTAAMENEYYAIKKQQEIAAHNQKIELLQVELKATQTKIQAELTQLQILAKIYEAMTGKSLDIKIDTAQGQAALAALDAQYKKLESSKIKVDVDTAQAESAIKKTEAAAKKGATIDVEADTERANKDLKNLKEENSSIVIEIQGEAEALKKDIEAFKQPTESKHTITGKVANKTDLDALKKDTSSTHTVYVKTVQTRQNGGEIFDIGRARGLESGGALAGYGGGDTVPTMLEPGEFVIRKEAVARYGHALMHNLNTLSLEPKIQKFATGGLVLGEADNLFVKERNSGGSSSSYSYGSNGEPTKLSLTLANPPFNAAVPDYDALVAELAKMTSAIEALRSSNNGMMSLETADKVVKLEAEQTALKDTYAKQESAFRSEIKAQSKAYTAKIDSGLRNVGASVIDAPEINPNASGQDDEIQGYIDDAKDTYQNAMDSVRDAIDNFIEPFKKYGATAPDLSSYKDLRSLSQKAIEVKRKADSFKNRDFSILESGGIDRRANEILRSYDGTRMYVPGTPEYQSYINSQRLELLLNGRILSPWEKSLSAATAEAQGLKNILKFQVGGDVPNLANGAKLSGYGGGDIVPAWLEPGEFVVRKEATSHYGGDLLHSINNLSFNIPSALKFQNGGPVPGVNIGSNISRDVNINIRGDRGENIQLHGDDAMAKALENYLRRRA